jgi:cytoskeletal protein CcmA (bactofilin family)
VYWNQKKGYNFLSHILGAVRQVTEFREVNGMLKMKNIAPMDTIIGENTTVIGNVESDSSIKVVGRIEGDIRAAGDVVILVNAVIKGDIWAENLTIAGTVNGNLHVKNNLHLESTARVKGDMELHSLVTDEGAVFEGNCRMSEVVSEAEPEKKKKLEFKRSKPIVEMVDEKEG